MRKRVVITGMEVLSSIGNTLEAFWQQAVTGKCGIRRIESYNADSYSTRIGGEIRDFDFSLIPHVNKPSRLTRVTQYALYCAGSAIERAGLAPSELARAGIFLGTGWGGTPEIGPAFEAFYSHGWKKVPPLTVLKGMPNSIANHVGMHFGIGGPNVTISNACVSSAEAISYAAEQIRHGRLAISLCGGSESLLWEAVMAAWCRMRVMSTRNEEPEHSCRPFDKDRDGMVIADGAGVLVLEDYEHARARGAPILAELIGWGASCDAKHITVPSMDGQVRAISSALDDARLGSGDVQFINAHGTATELNDKTETASIKQVFGEQAYNIPISAQKGMTGHTIGAAGVMDIIATTLSLQQGMLLPTINLQNPDPDCDLDYIPEGARKATVDIALSNHFAFGGANNVLILQKSN